ncbi:hypothetical protein [Pseudooceanicola antarcticus]|uniref:hypothetical protein n=1 Tax=Pseudooceanicola antarcticus TaxID=1247613 RepID=UPI001179ABBB|nr:hypothetical protein [Pseudooceanicola antarcticus]
MTQLVPEGADDPRFSELLRATDPAAMHLRLDGKQVSGPERYGSAKAMVAAINRLEPEVRLQLSVLGDEFGPNKEDLEDILFPSLQHRLLESFAVTRRGSDRQAAIQGLNVAGLAAVEASLRVRNGVLRDLKIGTLTLFGFGTVRLENCVIGRLIISGDGNPDIVIRGGRILMIDVEEDPHIRSLEVSGVHISKRPMASQPSKEDWPVWLRLDAVAFRRLHRWAQEKEDAKLAHQMRGHQLSVDYYKADRPERFFLSLWWLFGNYGLSLWRPLLWLLLSFAILVDLLLWCGSVPGVDQIASAVGPPGGGAADGWRRVLFGDDMSAQLARAVVGATESIFSPVNVFSTRKLVVPSAPWVAVFQFFYSYLCLGLIFLFGFSIRRRFKI